MDEEFIPDTEPPEYEEIRDMIKNNKKFYCVNEETANKLKLKLNIPNFICEYEFNNSYDAYIITDKTIIKDTSIFKNEISLFVI